MKAPSGKLALAYRSLAVAEERAERFMAERDALQVLLNQRDEKLGIYESFPGYLIDRCEGETVYEENLQRWLAAHIRSRATPV